MRRSLLAILLLGAGVRGAPESGPRIPLLDLIPDFQEATGGRILRNRRQQAAGLSVAGRRLRGLNCPVPSRIGYVLHGAFSRLTLEVGVLEDPRGRGVRVRVLGDGRTLVSTPPLFAGQPPLRVEVPLNQVLLLELDAPVGRGARIAWGNGELLATRDRNLRRFRAVQEAFSPRAYPAAFRRRVNRAIDSLVQRLQGAQLADGSWARGRGGRDRNRPGMTALALLALLKGGVKADDVVVRRGFEYLRARPFARTYAVSILLMALEAKYFPGGADEHDAHRERPRLARRIITPKDRAWMREAVDWLVSKQGVTLRQGQGRFFPVWRYPQGGYDLSNTQYALFGLSAANRCAIPTGKVWLPVLRFLLDVQEPDGPEVRVSRYVRTGRYLQRHVERAKARGFTYTLQGNAYGSMTAAGVCSLILCQQALHRNATFKTSFQRRTRAAIRDGLAWLEEYYDVEENPLRGFSWWAYYLFNLERTGVLLNQRYIGTRDWYREGAEALMAVQRRLALVDEAFALLFLKRATVPALTDPLR
ncbi:MAG: NPCBM/NEW2 domain-containing protein [Planctomycetota bacterium]